MRKHATAVLDMEGEQAENFNYFAPHRTCTCEINKIYLHGLRRAWGSCLKPKLESFITTCTLYNIYTMTKEELKELTGLLEYHGMNPLLCDSPVPYLDLEVKAGIPAMPGDPSRDEYRYMPEKFLDMNPTFIIDVNGDSMIDAGISSGDKVQIRHCNTAEDGDIVIALVDGEMTLKAFWRDKYGQCWLVPCNDAYKPIKLTEDMNARIIGKVTKLIKDMPRVRHANLQKAIDKMENAMPEQTYDPAEIIPKVAHMVHTRRHWIAVYRALVDIGVLEQEMFRTFVEMVTNLVPEHMHLPTVEVMRRMNVQCFTKPIDQWHPDNAPVSGSRYEEYLRIALTAKGER